jgi:hypothetical protein
MRKPYDSPAAWRGDEIQARKDWIHQLSDGEVSEIEHALAAVKAQGISIGEVTQENFPLKLFPAIASRALELLENGPGMFLIRGLPVMRHGVEDMRLVYWALGKYLGTAICQSGKGDVLGDVLDLSKFSDGRGRGYQSNRKLDFHTDSSDVVGLLVMRTAKSGGLSKIASSVTIHNEIARTRPELLEPLYGMFTGYSPGERAGGTWTQPIFSEKDGYFSCKTGRVYFELAHDTYPDRVPALTPLQKEALDYFQEIANRPEVHFSMMFQPGDLQLLNNHVTVHARTDFEDFEAFDMKRHLFRLWLSVPNSRPLSEAMKDVYRDLRPGAVRGGYPATSGKVVYQSIVT